MNRPQVAYFLSGPLVYFPSDARTQAIHCQEEHEQAACQRADGACESHHGYQHLSVCGGMGKRAAELYLEGVQEKSPS